MYLQQKKECQMQESDTFLLFSEKIYRIWLLHYLLMIEV